MDRAIDKELELLRKLAGLRQQAEYSRRLGLDPHLVSAQVRRGRVSGEVRAAMRGNISRGVTMVRWAMYRQGLTHRESGMLASTETPPLVALQAVERRRSVIKSWVGHGSPGLRDRRGRTRVIRSWAAKLGEDPPEWTEWMLASPQLRGRRG